MSSDLRSSELSAAIGRAADAIARADALLVTAGAGMGVDSGLPDFRGPEGFWRAYPAFRALGLRFEELADPRWFRDDPHLAWGFYGHRLNLYRATAPHDGFTLLRQWASTKPGGSFVFTSNVDGQFQKAGFDAESVVECHGSVHHFQCTDPSCGALWPADDATVRIDELTMRAADPLPACPSCGRLARPNVLMFGDAGWFEERTEAQLRRYDRWLRDRRDARLAIVECGAGTGVPTVRMHSEHVARRRHHATLVRINPREPNVPAGHVALPLASRAALVAIGEILR